MVTATYTPVHRSTFNLHIGQASKPRVDPPHSAVRLPSPVTVVRNGQLTGWPPVGTPVWRPVFPPVSLSAPADRPVRLAPPGKDEPGEWERCVAHLQRNGMVPGSGSEDPLDGVVRPFNVLPSQVRAILRGNAVPVPVQAPIPRMPASPGKVQPTSATERHTWRPAAGQGAIPESPTSPATQDSATPADEGEGASFGDTCDRPTNPQARLDDDRSVASFAAENEGTPLISTDPPSAERRKDQDDLLVVTDDHFQALRQSQTDAQEEVKPEVEALDIEDDDESPFIEGELFDTTPRFELREARRARKVLANRELEAVGNEQVSTQARPGQRRVAFADYQLQSVFDPGATVDASVRAPISRSLAKVHDGKAIGAHVPLPLLPQLDDTPLIGSRTFESSFATHWDGELTTLEDKPAQRTFRTEEGEDSGFVVHSAFHEERDDAATHAEMGKITWTDLGRDDETAEPAEPDVGDALRQLQRLQELHRQMDAALRRNQELNEDIGVYF
ncbi:hypothetical protein [Stenotrophomonas chelatiphaga]|uniref:hypothetical protein n=1 Tax=Stenotrophomonas chelatiphaga TaxID=517011 RepID=UPI000AFA150C|nr:hypothetical protein [Stenotrophomonas chelatiphaga]